MAQDGAMPTVSEPAFSMQPTSGTYIVIGQANERIKQLHTMYMRKALEAGRYYSLLGSLNLAIANENRREFDKALAELRNIHQKIKTLMQDITGHESPFMLPGPSWRIAVLTKNQTDFITHDDPAAW